MPKSYCFLRQTPQVSAGDGLGDSNSHRFVSSEQEFAIQTCEVCTWLIQVEHEVWSRVSNGERFKNLQTRRKRKVLQRTSGLESIYTNVLTTLWETYGLQTTATFKCVTFDCLRDQLDMPKISPQGEGAGCTLSGKGDLNF